VSCLVCGTGLVDGFGRLSSFIKDRSSKHRNILGCWSFLAVTELSKLCLKKTRVNIFLMDDLLKKYRCYFRFSLVPQLARSTCEVLSRRQTVLQGQSKKSS